MECWCVSNKHKSWLLLLMLMMMHSLMFWQTQGVCIKEERNALLKIKASLTDFYYVNSHLRTWVGDDGECCDWERVVCNPTTGHVTYLSLRNIIGPENENCLRRWPLNVSLFLHFKELTSLNLSRNCLDNHIVSTGFDNLSSLNLEILDLSRNYIGNDIFPPLDAFTSLEVLHLGYNELEGYFPALALENLEILDLTTYDSPVVFQMRDFERVSIFKKLKILNLGGNEFNDIVSLSVLPSLKALDLSRSKLFGSFPAIELAHLTSLEKLDLSYNDFYETPSIQDCRRLSRLKKLESIILHDNKFNESIILCLSALPSLKTLDLSHSTIPFGGSFLVQELAHMTNLEELDLSYNEFNDTPSIQDCRRLSSLKKLQSITLQFNKFNKSIISCLSNLPFLKILDLSRNPIEGPFPIEELFGWKELETLNLTDCTLESLTLNEMSHLPDLKLKALYLSHNRINGTLSMEALASFPHLEILDLSWNQFVGSIPSTIQALSSLKVVSFAYNNFSGSLPDYGLCELKNLHELDLSGNMFDGSLPQCFNRLLSLKLLDISSNRFSGTIPPSLIANLTSLEYVDFSNNIFEGSLSFSLFSNHTKLEVVQFISNNDKFEVETEEPIGWIPLFQLKVLVLSSCNINRRKGSVVPRFLHHQSMLQAIDLSNNALVGQLLNWLLENNTMLEYLYLRNNSISDIIHLSRYNNAKISWLDVSKNDISGTISGDMKKFLPNIFYLNFSSNSIGGVIPSSVGKLWVLDLSDNEFSAEVSNGLLNNLSSLDTLKLSNNRLHGQVLSGNLCFLDIKVLGLGNNYFTGKIGNQTCGLLYMVSLDISNNLFTGMIPRWMGNMMTSELIVSNNGFEGPFPCGTNSFSFLDISQNYFSGPIPSCLNLQVMRHLHLGSNRFSGPIPNTFGNLTGVLTLDIGNNFLSGKIPKFLGNLSDLRVLILRKNKFSGSIPKQLCQLSNVSLIDLSSNSLSGSIPSCLQNITAPVYPAFNLRDQYGTTMKPSYAYKSVLTRSDVFFPYWSGTFETQDEVQFTTKALSLAYKGSILDLMVGLDLSCNKLTGEIPKEVGLLTEIHSLNLSHNQLSGPIPMNFSNLEKIESLDLSSNELSGEIPSQLIKLNSLAVFNVSYNNLSGRLPEMKAQFGTFTKESYEGNPLLCGLPLEKKCTPTSPVTDPSTKEGPKDGNDKWYDVNMTSFYGSSGATWVVFLLGFVAVLYINPYWRRRWLDMVEECMYTCYYFLEDSVRKVSMVFRK